MKNLMIFLIAFFLFGIGAFVQAQNVGINSDGSQPDPSAMLDVKSSNTGLLIPQISLTAANVATPITNPATSLLIYNTATAGTSPNNVTPGYYYWNGSAWVRLSVSAGGSGTANFVTKWSTTGTLGNSLLFDNGGGVGVGTISPGAILDVAGRIWQTSTGESVFLGEGAGANDLMGDNQNVFVGYNAGYSNTSGSINTALGYSALYLNISGFNNTAIGVQALNNNETGNDNMAIGQASLYYNTSGNYNIAVGSNTLTSNTTGSYNTALGNNAAVDAHDLTNATAIGSNAMVATSNSLVLGSIEGVNGATASVMVGIGTAAPGTALDVNGVTSSRTTTGSAAGAGQFQSMAGGTAQGQHAVYSFYPTFTGSSDNVPRRASDILSGFNNVWGSEYLTFNVGRNGAYNDTKNLTIERMRIDGNGRIGMGTSTPLTCAALDITSTTRGFLPPRMTIAQRTAMESPSAGLIIWCSDCGTLGQLQVYNGTTWTNMTGGPAEWVCGNTLGDTRDMKCYPTILLGTQCWMAENLNIGTKIAVSSSQTNNGSIEKYCFSNMEEYCSQFGGLYQWAEVVQYQNGATNTSSWNPVPTGNVTGICPAGWHLPSDDELTALTTYVSSQPAYQCNSNATNIAKSLASTTYWGSSSNTCAVGNNLQTNNGTGFCFPANGYTVSNGTYQGHGYESYLWSSTEGSATTVWSCKLYYNSANVARNSLLKTYGFSVRCLKD